MLVESADVKTENRWVHSEGAENLSLEHERPEDLDPEVGNRPGDRAHRTAAPEVRRIGELQDLRGQRDVTLDHARRIGRPGAAGLEHLGQLGVHAWNRGEGGRAERAAAQIHLAHHLLDRARLLDHAAQLARVARLGDHPMGDSRGPGNECHVCVAGQHHPDRAGPLLLDELEQFGAVGPRHSQVRDDGILRLRLDDLDGLIAALDEAHVPLPAVGTERVTQTVEQLRIVVDEQDPLLHGAHLGGRGTHRPSVARSVASASGAAWSIGRRIVNFVPAPTSVAQLRDPR